MSSHKCSIFCWLDAVCFSLLLVALLLLLVLTLPLQLVDGFLGTVGDEVAAVIKAGPLRFPIIDIEDASAVEHVATGTSLVIAMIIEFRLVDDVPDVEILPIFWVLEVNQGGKQQNHVPPFIHDGCSAVCAADFARKFVDAGFLGAFVPAKIVVAVGEVDVVLVKDGCPLERGASKLNKYRDW